MPNFQTICLPKLPVEVISLKHHLTRLNKMDIYEKGSTIIDLAYVVPNYLYTLH